MTSSEGLSHYIFRKITYLKAAPISTSEVMISWNINRSAPNALNLCQFICVANKTRLYFNIELWVEIVYVYIHQTLVIPKKGYKSTQRTWCLLAQFASRAFTLLTNALLFPSSRSICTILKYVVLLNTRSSIFKKVRSYIIIIIFGVSLKRWKRL